MKGTVQMNLQSHTSVLNKLEVPKVNLENSAFTHFSLSSLNLSHFQKQLTFTLYLTTAGQNKCIQMLTIMSCSTKRSTGGSDQKDPMEPKLVLDPM